MPTIELFAADWRSIWGDAASHEDVGVIYTRPEIVDLILDLVGYSPTAGSLAAKPLLEPSCGDGAFLAAILERLFASERVQHGRIRWQLAQLRDAIRSVDLSPKAVEAARHLVIDACTGAGCPPKRAAELARIWVRQCDFLFESFPTRFAFVVGNPPYVRLEDLPKSVLGEYRARYSTLTDRADLYIAFFERGLDLLSEDGALAFICANRFTKNQYGAALRKLMATRHRVRHYVNLEHTQPFLQDVSAYPAILVVDQVQGGETQAATLVDIEQATLNAVREQARKAGAPGPLETFRAWFPSGGPWTTTSRAEFDLLDRLEQDFPTLEESGGVTKVGIGVATGADEVFVLDRVNDEIERALQLPLVMAGDVSSASVAWSGHYLLNPFALEDNGALVDLKQNPGLAHYLEANSRRLKARHVARSRPATWYRTIDRIWPKLTKVPKLLLPDIQQGGVIGLDPGRYYPHHNLYYISSDAWDLSALKALLRSSFIHSQVRAFSVQMRGGSLRYQAQTLRRLRLPAIRDLPDHIVSGLSEVAETADQAALDGVAEQAYTYRSPKLRIA